MYKQIIKDNQQNVDLLNIKRVKFKNKLWNPINFDKISHVDTHSWFNIIKKESNNKINNLKFIKSEKLEVPSFKCKKIIIKPSIYQRKILLNWLNAYIKMKNETIKFLKTKSFNNEKLILNFKILRTKYLKDIKELVWENTQLQNYKNNTKINKHILDCAIKDVCTMYKSCLTNMENKNIKHFRIRYIKQTKPKKILKLETGLFSKKINGFCVTIPGEMKMNNNFDCKKIKHESTLQYNSYTNRFVLLVPKDIENEDNDVKNKLNIAIDPGIRPFLHP